MIPNEPVGSGANSWRSNSRTVARVRTGPGDRVSLPYFSVSDMDAALQRVGALGGEIIHPGQQWSICRDTEGSPFGLTTNPA